MSTTIIIKKNGSISVEGDFTIQDADGGTFGLGGRTRVSLCRCGQSSKKPFCDGSHRAAGFEDACEAYDLPPMA